MKSNLAGGLLTALLALPLAAYAADEAAAVRANLKTMPRPWKAASYHPAPEDESYPLGDNRRRASARNTDWKVFEAALHYWAEKYPHAKLEKIGSNFEGDPLYCMTITDFSVPADKKFRVFIGATHGGPERNGMQSCMAAIEYLVSPEAAPYRGRFEVKVMPSLNPSGVFRKRSYPNSLGRDIKGGVCWDIKKLELLDPKTIPELAAYKKVMDEFQPELVWDCHGFDREFHGEIMNQTIMGSPGDQVVRTWSNSLIGALHEAANSTGMTVFPYEEEDGQRLISSRTVRDAHPRRFRHSYDSVETIMYPYLKFHAMPMLPEIGFDRMVADCLRGLFRYTDHLPPRNHRGLPVDNIFTTWGGQMIQSYGVLPGERRRSRVDLWSKSDNIHCPMLYPQASYHAGYAAIFGRDGYEKLFGKRPLGGLLKLDCGEVFAGRPDDGDYCWSAIRQFLKLGPERFFHNGNPIGVDFANMPKIEPPKYGLTMAADIPISPKYKVKMLDVRLNGKPLTVSAADGYELVPHNAGYRLFINVPPEKAKKLHLFIVTYAYDSDAKLTWGWEPEAAILERAKKVPALPPPPKQKLRQFPAIRTEQSFSFDLRPEVVKPAGLKLELAPGVVCADIGKYNMQQGYRLTANAKFLRARLPKPIPAEQDVQVSFNAVRENADSSWAFYLYGPDGRPWTSLFCDRNGHLRLFSAAKKYELSPIKLLPGRMYVLVLRISRADGTATVTVGEEQFTVPTAPAVPVREMRWDVQPPRQPVVFNTILFRCGKAAGK